MKKCGKYFLLMVLLLINEVCQSQVSPKTIQNLSRVKEAQSFKSKILKKEVKYSIYLPQDYFISGKRYPVLFLLHGLTDDETAWIQFGKIDQTADKAIEGGSIPSMIIVMPNGEATYYLNDFQNKVNFEDMFVEELIPYIETSYRTRPGKEFRAIAGLSMGGYGALHTSMRHPELFSACVALSAAVRTDEEFIEMDDTKYFQFFSNLYGPAYKKEERINDHWKKYSPLHLVNTGSLEKLKSVKWYLDCGDDDFLSTGNMHLHIKMKKVGLPHEFRIREGDHNWSYWRTGILDGLKFVGENFQR